MTTSPRPAYIGELPDPNAAVDVAYLTKYFGKADSGIAFTDRFYLGALARSPLSTLVVGNDMPERFPADGLRYTTSPDTYRLQTPRLQLVNGMGSFHHHLKNGYLDEHATSLKAAFVHDEPGAYDFYATDLWNRTNVRDTMMRHQDAFIFVSHDARVRWAEYAGLDDAQQFSLPNTCAEEPYIAGTLLATERDATREHLRVRDDVLNLVVVGTVQPRKAQLTAVRAVAHLRRTRPDLPVRLRLVGRVTQPAYRDEVAATIEAEGLGHVVTFEGQVTKEVALAYMRASDVLVVPSESEAMPLVLLEAMQIGTPVVTTPVGGVREVVDETCATFFEVGAADELAEQVARLADDPARRVALVDAARRRYHDEFSNERFHARFDAIVDELVTRTGTTPAPPGPGTASNAFELVVDDTAGHVAVQVTGTPDADPAPVRAALADLGTVRPVESAEMVVPGASIAELLALGAPFVRSGLDLVGMDPSDGCLRFSRDPALPVLLERTAYFEVVDGTDHLVEHQIDTRRRLRQSRQRAAREVAAAHRAAAASLEEVTGTLRWRAAGRAASVVGRSRVLRSTWRTALRATGRGRAGAPTPTPEPVERVPAVGMVFNSPLQLMAALSLWDQRYSTTVDDGTPLVAMIYSTNGSAGFGAQLAALCERTGRFTAVVDITEPYARLYEERPTLARCRGFSRSILELIEPYTCETVLVAAFMSARAQKMIYETFSRSTIRLFEDGIGSYVPKPVKLRDTGVVDRVTSGDCAEAHHVRLVDSVDLVLTSVPAPPQYGSTLPVRFPTLTVGGYRIDHESFAASLGAHPRSFAPDDVLLLTQNFSDHLGGRGYDAAAETAMNDDVVTGLVAQGRRVVVRPHPRASRPLWSPRWVEEGLVEVWTDDPTLPVEVLIDRAAPPGMLVGVSSSCLFYLREFDGMDARRYPEAAVAEIRARATEEFQVMLDIAADALPVLEPTAVEPASVEPAPVV